MGQDHKKGVFITSIRAKAHYVFWQAYYVQNTKLCDSSLDRVAYFVLSRHLHTSPGNSYVLKMFSIISPNASCTTYCCTLFTLLKASVNNFIYLCCILKKLIFLQLS